MKRMAPIHRLPWSLPVDRDRCIMRQCRCRRVLHLACASAPFTKELHESDQLLHDKLSRCAQDLCGVDLHRDALAYLESCGHRQLICADLMQREAVDRLKSRLPWQPDVVLAGELLEHLDRQGDALKNIASLLGPATKLVLSVPNAFSAKAFLRVCCGHEKVSDDHVSYFSLVNLKQLAFRSGLEIECVRWYASSFAPHPLERVLNWILWPVLTLRPQVADGIVVVCRLAAANSDRTGTTFAAATLDSTMHSDLDAVSQ